MVARVLFPVLTCRGERDHTPAPGDHKGPPFPTSSALAPTGNRPLIIKRAFDILFSIYFNLRREAILVAIYQRT